MAAAVVKQEDVLARNIVSAEMLIEDNTKSIENLVGVISFIEASQAEAGNRAAELKTQVDQLDSSTVEYQTKAQELARMAEVVNTLEQQHTEYVSRLYVAWTTTPQMRNLVKVSSDMRQKIGHASSQYHSNHEAFDCPTWYFATIDEIRCRGRCHCQLPTMLLFRCWLKLARK